MSKLNVEITKILAGYKKQQKALVKRVFDLSASTEPTCAEVQVINAKIAMYTTMISDLEYILEI